MTRTRHESRFAMAALAAAVLLCSPAARAGHIEDRPDGTTVLHVTLGPWVMPDFRLTDTATRAAVAALKAYQRRFPEIFAERYRARYQADPARYGRHNWDRVEIDLHQYSGIQVEGVETDLLAIAGKVAPDVLYVNFRKSDNYIQNSFLYPLDKPEDHYLTSMTVEEIDFRIHPKIWPVMKRIGPDGDRHLNVRLDSGQVKETGRARGRVWAVPFGGALGKVLLYRKDLFDEKRIPYPTVDWTWDDLLAAAKKLTDPKRGIYGMRLGRGKHESWYWVTFLWSAGGEATVYDDQTDQWRCTFGSREAAVALDFYVRLSAEKWIDADGKVRRGYAHKEESWAEGQTKWDRGEIGMQLDYIDEKLFSQINPELTGMVPVPLGPTGQRGGELNSRMLGLFSGLKDPAVRDAAWEYIRFIDSKEGMAIKTRIMVEGGFGRFVNPKYLRMFGYPEVIRLAPKGWAETFEVAIRTGKPEPYGRNCNYAYDLMTFPIEKAEQLARADKLPADPNQRLDVLQGLLRRWNQRANEQMIGIITPAERQKRDACAVGALTLIVALFVLVFWYIIRKFTPPKVPGADPARWGFRKYAWAYVLLLPAALTIFLWQYLPLARGSIMAFQDYRLLGESTWVWVQNFGDLLWDGLWWQAVWNAIRYSFLVMSLTFLPPIVLAVLLQEVPRGKVLFRTIFYLPAVTTALVLIIMWKQFYEPSEHGVLNALIVPVPAAVFLAVGGLLFGAAWVFVRRMMYHGMAVPAVLFAAGGVLLFLLCGALAWRVLCPVGEQWFEFLLPEPGGWLPRFLPRLLQGAPEPYNWRSDPSTAMLTVVIPMIWAGMGPGCLIYLAALKGISDDFYEAADLDGATFVDKILFVVFPMLKPLILINFLGVFIASFYGATAMIMVMTGGGANTEVAGLHIFYKAFIYLKFGPATAMAWVLAAMLIGFTVYQLRILSRLEFRTTGEKE
ncbi:MAG TPA: extracellular solute-binding protein [Phycisphaerae bacterium]|nr:extracellular solute-binding protein [Phycisphaerae bacterium]